MKEYLFTSEAVTEGHPDKVCDIISDTILDEALKQDKESKVAIETTIKDDFIFIYGEISSNAKIDFESIAKRTIKEIGYNENYEVFCKVSEQSEEINKAVNGGENQGAGDQGIMFGYACDETESLMPAAIYYANLLAKKLSMVSKRTNFFKSRWKNTSNSKICERCICRYNRHCCVSSAYSGNKSRDIKTFYYRKCNKNYNTF